MTKHHGGKTFMLGAMLGSTVGAISAMLCTKKKTSSFKKTAMEKLHKFEGFVKQLVHKQKEKVVKTMKSTSHRTHQKKTKAKRRTTDEK